MVTFFHDYQLNKKLYDFPYHYYRLIWNNKEEKVFNLDQVDFKYPRIILNLESFRFNFAIKKLTHY